MVRSVFFFSKNSRSEGKASPGAVLSTKDIVVSSFYNQDGPNPMSPPDPDCLVVRRRRRFVVFFAVFRRRRAGARRFLVADVVFLLFRLRPTLPVVADELPRFVTPRRLILRLRPPCPVIILPNTLLAIVPPVSPNRFSPALRQSSPRERSPAN